jgi:hypothetical protein
MRDMHRKIVEEYRSNKNAIHGMVGAQTHGSSIDRKGGSIHDIIYARVVYVGSADAAQLRQEVRRAAKL